MISKEENQILKSVQSSLNFLSVFLPPEVCMEDTQHIIITTKNDDGKVNKTG